MLATIHRAENTDCNDRLRRIIDALVNVANNVPVLFPVHPRTLAALNVLDVLPLQSKNIKLISPLSYLDMLSLEKHAQVIVTDSGGVQKEAFFFKVPCVVVRNETEWVELVRLGGAVLSPPEMLKENVNKATYTIPDEVAANLYGGGKASLRIACELMERSGRQ